ncbi:MAG: DUF2207 domain-containing protein [Candidatus Berkelbacteria bacterium]|nr:DUF2207 domain-containing protein [Candidatus Berkelbacteria bacterium]
MRRKTLTIVSQFPKGYLNLPLSKEVGRQINSIPGIIWILGGAVLPPIALIFLLIVIFGSKVQLFAKKVQGEVNKPPSRDSCALASILDYGRATEHLVMGVLVDLANRGFIDIYNQEKDFVIYQKNVSRHKRMQLKPYETILLEKIFLPKQTTVGSIDVEARLARHLYSRKLALVYLGIYDEGTSLGYFSDPPPKIHLKYRLIGIGSFFMGLLGYILFAIVSPDPKFVLFFWLSMIISGILIINFAPNITGFSRRGEILRGEWLKFKNFLSKDEILRGHDELFEKYLPYAVSMNVEAAWAARFIESNFIMPEWYNFPGEIDGVENFAKSLLPIIDYLGDALATSTDPLVR